MGGRLVGVGGHGGGDGGSGQRSLCVSPLLFFLVASHWRHHALPPREKHHHRAAPCNRSRSRSRSGSRRVILITQASWPLVARPPARLPTHTRTSTAWQHNDAGAAAAVGAKHLGEGLRLVRPHVDGGLEPNRQVRAGFLARDRGVEVRSAGTRVQSQAGRPAGRATRAGVTRRSTSDNNSGEKSNGQTWQRSE